MMHILRSDLVYSPLFSSLTSTLISRGPRLTSVVRSDQSRLLLIICLGLTKCKATLSAHPLSRSYFLYRFLES